MVANLSDILLNPLLLDYVIPHLSLITICSLVKTCKAFRNVFIDNHRLYQYVELENAVLQMLRRAPVLRRKPQSTESTDAGDGIPGSHDDNIDIIVGLPENGRNDNIDVVLRPETRNYGIKDLGEYIGITSDELQVINSHKRSLNKIWSRLVVAMLQNEGCASVPRTYSDAVDVSKDAFNIAFQHICERFVRAILQLKIRQKPMLENTHVLVLDGIGLGHTTIVTDIIEHVAARRYPISLLSVRETGILEFHDFFEEVPEMLKAGMKKSPTASDNRKRPVPLLGIYLFGKKDTPGLQLRRLRSKKDKENEGNHSGDDKNDIIVSKKVNERRWKRNHAKNGNKDPVLSTVQSQLGSQWHMLPDKEIDGRITTTGSNISFFPDHDWYQPTGRLVPRSTWIDSPWTWSYALETLTTMMMEDSEEMSLRFAFDAVLCRGPRHNREWVEMMRLELPEQSSKLKYIEPQIATIALGPNGCDSCGLDFVETASWPDSPVWELPLLSPIPKVSASVREAQRPRRWKVCTNDGYSSSNLNIDHSPKLVVRCRECLRGRYNKTTKAFECESCWYGAAYTPHFDDPVPL